MHGLEWGTALTRWYLNSAEKREPNSRWPPSNNNCAYSFCISSTRASWDGKFSYAGNASGATAQLLGFIKTVRRTNYPRNRSSTTDAHRLTRIRKALEELLRFTQWGNDLKSIFICVHCGPYVVIQNRYMPASQLPRMPVPIPHLFLQVVKFCGFPKLL